MGLKDPAPQRVAEIYSKTTKVLRSAGLREGLSLDPPTSHELQYEHDDCNHEKDVDEITHRLSGKSKTESPQNKQNN